MNKIKPINMYILYIQMLEVLVLFSVTPIWEIEHLLINMAAVIIIFNWLTYTYYRKHQIQNEWWRLAILMRNSKRKEIFFHDIIFRNTYYFMMGALHDFCEYKNGLNGALFLLEMWNTWYIFWYIQDRQAWKDTANMQDFPSGLL